MLSVETTVRETDPAWLVSATVANRADEPLTVRLRAATPVMPPRRRGVPAEGWDGRTVRLTVPAGQRRGVGFATREAPPDPPVEVVDRSADEPGSDRDDPHGDLDDPDAVVRTLGDARPPRDAVPAGDPPSGTDPGDAACDDPRATADADAAAEWEWVEEAAPASAAAATETTPEDERTAADGDADLPPAVADWFADVARRCERVERVDPGAPLSAATASLTEAGGRAALERDAERLAADARRLRAVAERAAALADRAAEPTLPRSALEALS